MSSLAMSMCPPPHAYINAVNPSSARLALTSAPFSMSSLAVSVYPPPIANINDVTPSSVFLALTSAPFSISRIASSVCPPSIAASKSLAIVLTPTQDGNCSSFHGIILVFASGGTNWSYKEVMYFSCSSLVFLSNSLITSSLFLFGVNNRINTYTTFSAATIDGVKKVNLGIDTAACILTSRAPLSVRNFTISVYPFSFARLTGVFPLKNCLFRSSPALISFFTTFKCSLSIAAYSGVVLSIASLFLSARLLRSISTISAYPSFDAAINGVIPSCLYAKFAFEPDCNRVSNLTMSPLLAASSSSWSFDVCAAFASSTNKGLNVASPSPSPPPPPPLVILVSNNFSTNV